MVLRVFERFAERPPKLAPREAARRVVARLEPRGAAAVRRWAAAAAIVLTVAAGGWLAARWIAEPRPEPAPPAAAQAALPLDEGVVLLCPTHGRRVRHTVFIVAGTDGIPTAVVLVCAITPTHRGYALTRE